MDDMSLLTVGLMVFAGTQIWVQWRNELQRRAEREADRDEYTERAFQLAWSEHFRLEALAEHLRRADLIELAILGVLKPEDVLPRDWTAVAQSLGSLSREAGYLGGVALAMGHDIERQIGIFVDSARAFAREAPMAGDSERVAWVRAEHGEDLEPWEKSVRELVTQLGLLYWDAASHNPRIAVEQRLDFSDDMKSSFGKAAVASVVRRSLEQELGCAPRACATAVRRTRHRHREALLGWCATRLRPRPRRAGPGAPEFPRHGASRGRRRCTVTGRCSGQPSYRGLAPLALFDSAATERQSFGRPREVPKTYESSQRAVRGSRSGYARRRSSCRSKPCAKTGSSSSRFPDPSANIPRMGILGRARGL